MVDSMGECLMESMVTSMGESPGESLDLVEVVVLEESLELELVEQSGHRGHKSGRVGSEKVWKAVAVEVVDGSTAQSLWRPEDPGH